MPSRNSFLFIAAFVFASAHAVQQSASSPSSSQPQRMSTAEGTFVRGMMTADQQFGLYMTVSETNRGGGSSDAAVHHDDDSFLQEGNGHMSPVHDTIVNVRDVAVNFADVVRRRVAFAPPPSVDLRQHRHRQ